MEIPQYKELQNAVGLLRQFLHGKMDLDYSVYSVKNLDDIITLVYKDGKLKNATNKFAKYEGHIMLGISGYLTEVILKNTTNTKFNIANGDDRWYLNFTLTAENGASIQPAQQVKKRIAEGNNASLYNFCLAAIKSFNQLKENAPGRNINFNEVYFHDEANNKKPWWKFW